ncbi:HalOD1 output domain-containing protein [Halomarina pelagica]|uniref:HalOD1 output domain-containing protein n=1 Tax=Halomarina pelagica TaxID=2961599 RepID=UPI0020C2FC3C|nr:HalOD1 output domain-containing protein [Halomarina sp. BND7]
MDKERSGQSPSIDTGQEHREPTSTNWQMDAPTPGETADGGWDFVTQAHYDPAESRDLTTVIIGAIADTENVPGVEVKTPPLYEMVDVTGIENALFGRPDANRNDTDSTVEFRYNQYKVSVDADGWVTVAESSGRATTDEA